MDIVGGALLADGSEAKVVTGLDDHSRFCVIATVVRRATGRAVCAAFAVALTRFGVPGEVLTDMQAVHWEVQPTSPGGGDVRTDLPGERHRGPQHQAPVAHDDGQGGAVPVRHAALGRIPGAAGRDSKGGSWV